MFEILIMVVGIFFSFLFSGKVLECSYNKRSAYILVNAKMNVLRC